MTINCCGSSNHNSRKQSIKGELWQILLGQSKTFAQWDYLCEGSDARGWGGYLHLSLLKES